MILPAKVRLFKAVVFRVVMYGWESWAIKKAERQRIDATKLMKARETLLNCGVEKTLESPLDCKEIKPVNPKGNQS